MTNNVSGFDLYNIQHTSASSVNTWQNAPDVWVAEKIFGHKVTVGAAAHRGNAVEAALVNILAHGVDKEQAVKDAISIYNTKTVMLGDKNTEQERDAISGCVDEGMKELAPLGKPYFAEDGTQHKIELVCAGDGWKLPVIGYLDLVYPDKGLIVDLKTTLRAPSKMSPEHTRQAAIYRRAAGNSAVKFLYLTPNKAIWHECRDMAGTLAEGKGILNRQEYLLRKSGGEREELARLVHFNPNTFYWNGTGAGAIQAKMYGV